MKKHGILTTAFLTLALCTSMQAQLQLVKDINMATGNSDPSKGAVIGNLYINAMTDADHGTEVWATDITTGNSIMVKDISAGLSSSNPLYFTAYNGEVYFQANDPLYGRELWKTNGTAAGTVLVMDIETGGNADPSDLTVFNGKLYFGADDFVNGRNLWCTDGTNTVIAAMITPYDISPQYITAFGSKLLFSGFTTNSDYELWTYDGTTATVIDINPSGSSYPEDITVSGGYAYFSADDGTTGLELYRYDGNAVTLVSNINSSWFSSDPSCFVPFGSGVAFIANGGSSVGREWYYFDGATTTLLADINPGGNWCSYTDGVADAAVINAMLVFGANNGTQEELWMSDGTPGGTTMIDVNPMGSSYAQKFSTAFGGYVYFRADGGTGYELYRTDGANTTLFAEILSSGSSSPENFFQAGSVLFFSADNGIHGKELWWTDGTIAGTDEVVDVMSRTTSSNIGRILVGNSFMAFGAEEAPNGYEVFVSDGTAAGTHITMNVDPTGDGFQDEFAVNGNWVFFSAYEATYGIELWKSDGANTQLVMDIDTTGDSEPYAFATAGAWTYFTAYTSGEGYELWKTDGTTTAMVKDIAPGTSSSYPKAGVEMGGYYYFIADDGTYGEELWKTDGSTAGTVMVADIYPGTGNEIGELVTNGVLVLYVTENASSGVELFATDGTNTFLVSDINPAGNSDPGQLTVIGNWIYFSADDGTNGVEAWRTDGLTTQMLGDINTSGGSNPYGFCELNGAVYFGADDGTNGIELWEFDGSNTSMVANIGPGAGDGYPEGMIAYYGKLYFSANDFTTGYELWTSDGTAGGTQLVQNMAPGYSHSSPNNFTLFMNTLYFVAGTDTVGSELWKYIPPTAVSPFGIAGNICQTTIFTVGFNTSGPVNAGNIYTAELSDNTGNFAAPTVIGSLTSTAATGFINVLIPQSVTAGTGYRIRVNASNPSATGIDNGYNLTLLGSPTLSVSAANSSVCAGSGLVSLAGAPAGGSWYGTGVSGNDFDPVSAGVGSFTVFYFYMDTINGCSNTDSLNLQVNALPVVNAFAASGSVCLDDANVTLTGTPAAGTWTGTGVSGTQFDPTTAGNGTHDAVYTYTDANGCAANDTVSITVNACVGIGEQVASHISIYPNPNNGIFTVEASENCSVIIYNVLGEVVYSHNTTEDKTEIDLTGFTNGLYQLMIVKDGRVIHSASVSKQ